MYKERNKERETPPPLALPPTLHTCRYTTAKSYPTRVRNSPAPTVQVQSLRPNNQEYATGRNSGQSAMQINSYLPCILQEEEEESLWASFLLPARRRNFVCGYGVAAANPIHRRLSIVGVRVCGCFLWRRGSPPTAAYIVQSNPILVCEVRSGSKGNGEIGRAHV